MEYLVQLTTVVPPGTDASEVTARFDREALVVRDLASAGKLLRLWRPPLGPGERKALGLFVATDETALHDALGTLPLAEWMTFDITALGEHPNDPALAPEQADVS